MPYQQTGSEAGRGGVVADPAALTSATVAAAPTAAEHNALRADVVALRGTVAALITALRNANLVD